MMEILTVNVGLPREVLWKDRLVTTSIFKEPASGRVKVRSLNLDGDKQADLTVHGGIDKAVYAYPFEHYDAWRAELPHVDFPIGIFGENLTITGLKEEEVNIGDRFRVGSAELKVTQPRMPCYKLGIRFGRSEIVQRLLNNHRSGFYFSVVKEGEVAAGDTLECLSRDEHHITVADIFQLYTREKTDLDLLHRVTQLESLPESWRDYFQKQIDRSRA